MTHHPSLTLVMPTIDWGGFFAICLPAALAGLGPEDEALVVFDGDPPPPPAWLSASRARLLRTPRRSGPGVARNQAALEARGDVLLFVDADVELHPTAIARIREHFARDPDLVSVFGSYDDDPVAPGRVSRFRNLLHHHTHSVNAGPAASFWAGCGAIRRDRFLALGGFDGLTYPRPSIEDIELGTRMAAAGDRVLLDPTILCRHHKRWTLVSMLRTDIRDRAIPWSRLILQQRSLPTSLNLDWSARFSGLASLVLVLALPLLPVPGLGPVAAAGLALALGALLLLNRSFYATLVRCDGPLSLLWSVPLHVLYYLSSSLVFGGMVIRTRLARLLPQPRASQP
ncbi:MAG: glycosyltransferase [Cyanobacteriota bacterium]|nr:glycosyltransferase [Cyanobacteriota bacterium]